MLTINLFLSIVSKTYSKEKKTDFRMREQEVHECELIWGFLTR